MLVSTGHPPCTEARRWSCPSTALLSSAGLENVLTFEKRVILEAPEWQTGLGSGEDRPLSELGAWGVTACRTCLVWGDQSGGNTHTLLCLCLPSASSPDSSRPRGQGRKWLPREHCHRVGCVPAGRLLATLLDATLCVAVDPAGGLLQHGWRSQQGAESPRRGLTWGACDCRLTSGPASVTHLAPIPSHLGAPPSVNRGDQCLSQGPRGAQWRSAGPGPYREHCHCLPHGLRR